MTSRKGSTERAISIVTGAAVVFVVGWMTCEATGARPPTAHPVVAASSSAPVSPPDAAAAAPAATADLDAGLFLPTLSLGDAGVLATNAPRSVKIGVVLVAFAGAEGAAANARSKKDALVIAERLSAEAKTDFPHAVSAGDSGSAGDIGRLPRGVLDPRTEVAVFNLAAGDVSEVLETPRGYWIVKRLE